MARPWIFSFGKPSYGKSRVPASAYARDWKQAGGREGGREGGRGRLGRWRRWIPFAKVRALVYLP